MHGLRALAQAWKVESAPFTTPDVENLLMCWLSEQQQVQLQEQGQIDFAVTLTDSRRLRASAFVHQQGTSLALRLLPLDCPHLDDLQPPAVIPELLHSENGLILVTGATGSGKSTTRRRWWSILISILRAHSDAGRSRIEYRYTSRRCLIQQRGGGAPAPLSPPVCAVRYAKIPTLFCWASCATWKPFGWH